ncbi:hypothetical protein SAMN03097699_1156 [Flavobacteriaceae bacterium MAR_2010_188]|nr:hypothetical protein SAMN03097699_1156 [Flavobacteriaceae bacterium MAR_2010_188]
METINKNMQVYRAADRGFANHGWLQAAHSFSFANYYDPKKMQFGALRVLNDDIVGPGMGFGTHPHENMEIITIPLEGALKHRDSMHNEWQPINVGEVQIMSAGTGVQHSEMNGSPTEKLRLFQIWIIPNKQNVEPRYGQKKFDVAKRKDNLQVLVSSIDNPVDGSLTIHQDAQISRIDLEKDKEFTYNIKSQNHGVYMLNITGEVLTDSVTLEKRDAIGISQIEKFNIKANEDSSVLFIEVPLP